MAEAVPVAATLGLECPEHGCQLEDAIGPYWCPAGEHDVSAWDFVDPVALALIFAVFKLIKEDG